MNVSNLQSADWYDLLLYHPNAYAFLLKRSKDNEIRSLLNKETLSSEERNRLEELQRIKL